MGLNARVREHRYVRGAAFLAQNAAVAIKSGRRTARTRSARPEVFLAAMVRVKDEGRFLPEWIAYHQELGVEKFFVYDNGSTDGTASVLGPFISEGSVELVDWPHRPVSPSADLHFLENFGPSCRWVAMLDADEFIRVESPHVLRAWLEREEASPAVAMNWRYFGSSYFESVPDGLVVENFVRADATLDRHVKVIVQPGQVLKYRNPHNHYYRRGRLARTVDHRRVLASFAETAQPDAAVVLNHYVYRSRADYERKVLRGYATSRGEVDMARRRSRIEREFPRHNDTVQPVPSELLSRVKLRLSALGIEPSLFESDSTS